MKILRCVPLLLSCLFVGASVTSCAETTTPIPLGPFLPGNTVQHNNFVISTDGQEVTDPATGLIWRRCTEGMSWDGSTCTGNAIAMSHEKIMQRANEFASSTGVAWRVPNIRELATIGYTERHSDYPAIDHKAFPATPYYWFWSSTIDERNPDNAWYLSFAYGSGGSTNRKDPHFARFVRGEKWWK